MDINRLNRMIAVFLFLIAVAMAQTTVDTIQKEASASGLPKSPEEAGPRDWEGALAYPAH